MNECKRTGAVAVRNIQRSLRTIVRVDEEHIKKATEWLADSVHQHFDDLLRTICAGLVAGSVKEWGGTLLAATLMGGSILLLTTGLHIGKRIQTHREMRSHIVKDSDPEWQSFRQALNEAHK